VNLLQLQKVVENGDRQGQGGGHGCTGVDLAQLRKAVENGDRQGQGGDGQRDGRLDREQRHGQANLNRMGGVLHLLNAMVRQWRLSGHATADGNIIQQRVSSVNDAAFHWYTIRATIIMRHSLMVELQLRLRKSHDDGVVLIFNSHQY
jgi:hypothetical protein